MNKMRTRTSKLIISFMVLVMIITLAPVRTQASNVVKINKSKTTMYIGSPQTLRIKGTSQKVTWSSSNKRIATVSSKGKVNPKRTGSVVITGKVDGKSYRCNVTVKKPYLSATKKTTYKNANYKIILRGTSIKRCISRNKNIATVKKTGKNTVIVNTKKAGNVTIRIKGKNNKIYTCKIKVLDKVCKNHKWVEQFKTVHHDEVSHTEKVCISEAWDEEIWEEHAFCSECGEDFGSSKTIDYDYVTIHCADCQGGASCYSNSICVGTIHHDAEYKTKKVVDKKAYDEKVSCGYKCSKCGATK